MGKAAVREIRSKPAEQPIAPLIRELLDRLGEDPRRDGLGRTPERVSEAFRLLTSGYQMDVHRMVNGAFYEVQYPPCQYR
jgi:GTP cyclohydrolase I